MQHRGRKFKIAFKLFKGPSLGVIKPYFPILYIQDPTKEAQLSSTIRHLITIKTRFEDACPEVESHC